MLKPFNSEEHLELIVDLHYKILPWGTNSRLGKPHIFNIYQALTNLPSTFGYVWIYEGELIGFSLGSLDYSEARAGVKSVYGWKEIFKLLVNSFAKPLYLINALDTVFFIPPYLKKCGVKAEWLGWITDKSQGKSRVAAIQCYYALKKHYADHGHLYFIGQIEKRSKFSAAFLDRSKNIRRKSFLQNYVYLIDSHAR